MAIPAKPNKINIIITKKISVEKSPGHDLITNFIVKNLQRKAIIYLSHLFNTILRLSYFPSAWKYYILIIILNP